MESISLRLLLKAIAERQTHVEQEDRVDSIVIFCHRYMDQVILN